MTDDNHELVLAEDSPSLAAVTNDIEARLPAIIDRMRANLAEARTVAEVLEVRSEARVTYDAVKIAIRFAKTKGAHDDLLAIARKVQGDALELEARSQVRLADEYDQAQ